MKTKTQLGIWMDHSVAHIMEYHKEAISSATLKAQIGEQDEPLNSLDESMIQNKEQNQLSSFFKRISEVVKDYDEVLLFGPTDSKTELFNVLKIDRHFEKIKIEIKPADKMTDNQMQAFVKDYFTSTN
ncbi:MAG: hypothetical protein JW842_07220 [Prolixibacteraceae bacterium]|nr:hypothetical protein [Prolixibacteraceae bacterium]